MSRYITTQHVKKKYFTKSHNNLPSPHPKQEFLSLINLKKQYQSMIKEELNVLETIQNAQARDLQEWQRKVESKEICVEPFVVKQQEVENIVEVPKKVQEKMVEEVRSCYEKVRLLQVHKHTIRVLGNLKEIRKKEVRKRAGSYLYHQNICQKFFKIWFAQTCPQRNQYQSLQIKTSELEMHRKKPFFKELSKLTSFSLKSKKLQSFVLKTIKAKFLKSFALEASRKYTEAIAEEGVQKILKKRIFKSWKNHYEVQNQMEQVREKQRLLENIYCHRRFNSFFSFYRKSKFRKEHSQITKSIINKIDLPQLIGQDLSKESQLIEPEQMKDNVSERLEKVEKEGKKVNASLLNLILQNFIEEYSQQYDYALNQQQFDEFLYELKTQCVCRMISNSQKANSIKLLSLNKKISVLYEEKTFNYQQSFVHQLILHKNISEKSKVLKCQIKEETFSDFRYIVALEKQLNGKIKQLQQTKIVKNLLSKSTVTLMKQNFLNKKMNKFKTEIAKQWRNSYLLKQSLRGFCKYNEWDHQNSIREDEDQNCQIPHQKIDDYYEYEEKPEEQVKNIEENIELQKSREEIISELKQQKQQDEYENFKFSKVKYQLSKIVNVIGKGVSPNKSSFDSIKKSIDSQSNKPVTRLKTQSDPTENILKEEKNQEEKEIVKQKYKYLSAWLVEEQLKRFFQGLKINFEEKCQLSLKKSEEQTKTLELKSFLQRKIWSESLKYWSQTYQISKKIEKIEQIFENKHKKRISESLRALQNEKQTTKISQSISKQLKVKRRIQFFNTFQERSIFLAKKDKIRHEVQQKQKYLQKYFFYSLKNIWKSSQKVKYIENLILRNKSQSFMNNFFEEVQEIREQKEKIEQRSYHDKINISQGQHQDIQKQLSEQDGKEYSKELSQFSDGSHNNVQKEEQSHVQQYQNSEQKFEDQQSVSEKQQSKGQLFNYLFNQQQYSAQNLVISQKAQTLSEKSFKQNDNSKIEGKIQQLGDLSEGQKWISQQIKAKEGKKIVNKNTQSKIKNILANKYLQSSDKKQVQQESSIVEEKSEQSFEKKNFDHKIQMLENMRKSHAFLQFIRFFENAEQQKIKEEELEEIVKFSQQKRQKVLKKKCFEDLNENKKDKATVKVCFIGWLNFYKQKKMLKRYLKLEEENSSRDVSYYPRTLDEKKVFQQLQHS